MKLVLCIALLIGFTGFAVAADLDESVSVLVEELAERLVASIDGDSDQKTIGVTEFEPATEDIAILGIHLAITEMVSNGINQSQDVIVVEKRQLESVVETLELELTGLYEEQTVAAVGKLLGAQYIVLGHVSKIGDRYLISSHLVQVETGIVVGYEYLEVPADLLEEQSKTYRSPKYRILIGPTIGFLSSESSGSDMTVGVLLEMLYELYPQHYLSFNVSQTFFETGFNKSPLYGVSYYAERSQYETQISIGYAFLLEFTEFFHSRLGANLGYLTYIWLDLTGVQHYSVNLSRRFHVAFIEPCVDFILAPNLPVSFFATIRYRIPFWRNQWSYEYDRGFGPGEWEVDSWMSTVTTSAGIEFHF